MELTIWPFECNAPQVLAVILKIKISLHAELVQRANKTSPVNQALQWLVLQIQLLYGLSRTLSFLCLLVLVYMLARANKHYVPAIISLRHTSLSKKSIWPPMYQIKPDFAEMYKTCVVEVLKDSWAESLAFSSMEDIGGRTYWNFTQGFLLQSVFREQLKIQCRVPIQEIEEGSLSSPGHRDLEAISGSFPKICRHVCTAVGTRFKISRIWKQSKIFCKACSVSFGPFEVFQLFAV